MDAAVNTPVRAAARVVWRFEGKPTESLFRLGGPQPSPDWAGVPLADDTLWVWCDRMPKLLGAWPLSPTRTVSLWDCHTMVSGVEYELLRSGDAIPLGRYACAFGPFTLLVGLGELCEVHGAEHTNIGEVLEVGA